MELMIFKTLWGHPDNHLEPSLATACQQAQDDGYKGIEGPVPVSEYTVERFANLLAKFELAYIAEICTAGSYVPDRYASVEDHLRDLDRQLKNTAALKPVLVNCIGGCDRWSLSESLSFFDSALDLANRYNIAIAFETHRGRSLYSPWQALQILESISLPLTCDFSHWCVVCEGFDQYQDEILGEVAQHARHIHGRIGFDQGPQVADPRLSWHQKDLEDHLRWWTRIWQAQEVAGQTYSTFTPEFGPDGYQALNPQTGEPVGELAELNRWMANIAQAAFSTVMEIDNDTRFATV
jgi:sugar phosphate isomerase/epimerase